MALERGELRWQMAVPRDGRLPFDGAFPALMAWECDRHPTDLLPDEGCRVRCLELEHPQPKALRRALGGLGEDQRIEVMSGAATRLRAIIETPKGVRVLA